MSPLVAPPRSSSPPPAPAERQGALLAPGLVCGPGKGLSVGRDLQPEKREESAPLGKGLFIQEQLRCSCSFAEPHPRAFGRAQAARMLGPCAPLAPIDPRPLRAGPRALFVGHARLEPGEKFALQALGRSKHRLGVAVLSSQMGADLSWELGRVAERLFPVCGPQPVPRVAPHLAVGALLHRSLCGLGRTARSDEAGSEGGGGRLFRAGGRAQAGRRVVHGGWRGAGQRGAILHAGRARCLSRPPPRRSPKLRQDAPLG